MSCCLVWFYRPPRQLVIQLGSFSYSFQVRLTPLLKKPGLNKSLPSNYRPISHLNTISKVLERLFLNRVHPSFPHQTSTNFKTLIGLVILLKLFFMQPDIFTSSDSENSLFVSIDLSAAFDSIDHAILLIRLKTSFGLDGLVYHWIESYLTDRMQTVTIGNNSSATTHVASGVPQGSVFGSLLFNIYTSPIASIASTFSVPQQQFADDSQLYSSLSPSNFHGQIHRLEDCLFALHAGAVITPFPSILIIWLCSLRNTADHVRLLGVTLDNCL